MHERRSSWAAFRDNLLRFEAAKLSPWIGLRNAIGVALPLAIGFAVHARGSGLLAATGALNVAFSDSHAPYIQRARRMLAASAVVGIGVFSGALCGGNHALTLMVVTAWAFATGNAGRPGPGRGRSRRRSASSLCWSSRPRRCGPSRRCWRRLVAFCGGVLQTALSVALWPLRRYTPERRALADLFRGLAASADWFHAARQSRRPPPPRRVRPRTHWRPSTATIRIEAERYRSLLSQAERMRLGLLVLARLRTRIAREDAASPAARLLDGFFELAGELLGKLAGELTSGHSRAPGSSPWRRCAPSPRSCDPDRAKPCATRGVRPTHWRAVPRGARAGESRNARRRGAFRAAGGGAVLAAAAERHGGDSAREPEPGLRRVPARHPARGVHCRRRKRSGRGSR